MSELSKIVKTIDKNGNDQYWIANLTIDRWIGIRECIGGNGKFYDYRVQKLVDAIKFEPSRLTIEFVPIVANEPLAEQSRLYHRGFIDNSEPHKSDKAPFIYRGAPMPEIKFTFYNGSEEGFTQSYSSITDITPGAKSFIKQQFGTQLAEYVTPDFRQFMVDNAIATLKANLKNDLDELVNSAAKFWAAVENM